MRRQSLVAGVVLTAALATLVALPGVAGSQTPGSVRPLTAGAFQKVRLPASTDGLPLAVRPLDAGYESAGHLDDSAQLIEPGPNVPTTGRPSVTLPAPRSEIVATPQPKRTATSAINRQGVTKRVVTPVFRAVLSGIASWYDNGTTAMRLPHGTRIRICGAKSCVTRVVRDWGPARWLAERVVDLTPADFVSVTGESLATGLAPVTVYIYV